MDEAVWEWSARLLVGKRHQGQQPRVCSPVTQWHVFPWPPAARRALPPRWGPTGGAKGVHTQASLLGARSACRTPLDAVADRRWGGACVHLTALQGAAARPRETAWPARQESARTWRTHPPPGMVRLDAHPPPGEPSLWLARIPHLPPTPPPPPGGGTELERAAVPRLRDTVHSPPGASCPAPAGSSSGHGFAWGPRWYGLHPVLDASLLSPAGVWPSAGHPDNGSSLRGRSDTLQGSSSLYGRCHFSRRTAGVALLSPQTAWPQNTDPCRDGGAGGLGPCTPN